MPLACNQERTYPFWGTRSSRATWSPWLARSWDSLWAEERGQPSRMTSSSFCWGLLNHHPDPLKILKDRRCSNFNEHIGLLGSPAPGSGRSPRWWSAHTGLRSLGAGPLSWHPQLSSSWIAAYWSNMWICDLLGFGRPGGRLRSTCCWAPWLSSRAPSCACRMWSCASWGPVLGLSCRCCVLAWCKRCMEGVTQTKFDFNFVL